MYEILCSGDFFLSCVDIPWVGRQPRGPACSIYCLSAYLSSLSIASTHGIFNS
jgi:hypothetical protein